MALSPSGRTRGLALFQRPSVCPSICPSLQVKTAALVERKGKVNPRSAATPVALLLCLFCFDFFFFFLCASIWADDSLLVDVGGQQVGNWACGWRQARFTQG